MRITIIAVLLFCLHTFTASAQNNYSIKGTIADTSSTSKLDYTTICVLNAKDSILQKYTYAKGGSFAINNLAKGNYLLLVSYPGYADYTDHFILDSAHTVHEFGRINMILQSKLLNEVIIKAKVAAIKIKGDTTEFNAAAYITQKNAKIEDLLKQLQGMRVDQNGKVTFQGVAVDKILIDGEEFFKDDPTLITKNLRADMVNKVQVYDKKSENAIRTGIEDGVKVKTVNIQLREDKKRGIFGKTEADYGTHNYYLGQAMFNKFNDKEKFAIFGSINNMGKPGLNGSSGYGGVGIPLERSGGLHYNSTWDKEKQSFNTDYRISTVNINGTGNTLTQNNLPGNYNTTNTDKTFHNSSFNQGIDLSYNTKIDTTSEIDVSINAEASHITSANTTITTTLRGNGVLLNTNNNNTNSDNDNKALSSYLNYNKRFKKKGRSISVNMQLMDAESSGKENLKSALNYYNDQGVRDSSTNIDQYKPNSDKDNYVGAGVSYTEPLSKSLSLSASYNINSSNGRNNKQSFNKSASGEYDLPDNTLSSNFTVKKLTNIYGANINYYTPKTTLQFSMEFSSSNFKQTDQVVDTTLTRTFINWRPGFSGSYQLNKSASINISYSGGTSQPSIDQLQPLKQNNDPLNIKLGNPGLKPQFGNSLSFNYRLYQASYDRGINFRTSYSNTINTIISNRITDSTGVSTSQWSNLKNKQPFNWETSIEFYGNIPKIEGVIYLDFNANGSTYYNYINNQLNEAKATTYSPRISFSKNKASHSFGFGAGPTYTVNTTSLQSVNNNSYGFSADANYFVKLPGGFYMGSECSYQYNAKTQAFDRDFRKTLLKSYVGKSLLKDESLKMAITGNDLLNQNTGYSRDGTSGNFTESRNTIIRRNILFSVSWDFSKFGKEKQKQ
ncbi:Outer membrane protein beta-barrel family protein [Mucilaginibacter pineti]|uniref:Outer membrane protein beta-barrel family protein n=1 Tax=Mucilaginibacter pineti TaxID=1391627 RepID=A0A1G7D924_9SPHI|nr:TonB-dependent receptor [Mucilaginibacter pineti]SDE48052.1 Outer membrane protein beta-barrel family protein [Mucilaginibacter pineti]